MLQSFWKPFGGLREEKDSIHERGAYNGYMRALGPAAYCGNMGQGVQLLTVST